MPWFRVTMVQDSQALELPATWTSFHVHSPVSGTNKMEFHVNQCPWKREIHIFSVICSCTTSNLKYVWNFGDRPTKFKAAKRARWEHLSKRLSPSLLTVTFHYIKSFDSEKRTKGRIRSERERGNEHDYHRSPLEHTRQDSMVA